MKSSVPWFRHQCQGTCQRGVDHGAVVEVQLAVYPSRTAVEIKMSAVAGSYAGLGWAWGRDGSRVGERRQHRDGKADEHADATRHGKRLVGVGV